MPESRWSGAVGLWAQVGSHVRTPLFGGAYALILSSTVSSGLGIVYWALAARLYDAEHVGANAAAISAMILISYLAQLNMAGVLSRFIPTTGPEAGRLVLLAYLAAGVVSAVGALIFVIAFARFVGLGPMLTGDPRSAAWFVVATVAWSLFTLQDGVLTGLRQTFWVPIENSVFGAAKIILLIVFVTGLADLGIFASWTIPAAVLVIPVNWLIFRRLLPRRVVPGRQGPTSTLPPGTLRYLSGDFIGSLFNAASIGLLPLVVVVLVGARGGAYFYIAWTIAFSLYLISVNMATSLMVEGAARRATVAHDSLRMFRLLVGVQSLVVLVVSIAAPLILSIFNPAYATEAAPLLRLLTLAVLPHGVNSIFLALARVRRQVGRIIMVQATLAILSLGTSALLLGPLGIVGAGIGWLTAQTVVAAILLATQLLPLWLRRPSGVREEPSATESDHPLAAEPRPWPRIVHSAFAALDAEGIRWCLLRGDRDELARGARDIDLLVSAPDWPRLDDLFARSSLLRVSGDELGPGGSFVGHDAETGTWVNLDVVVGLAYGRFDQLDTGVAAGCLARLGRHDGIPILSPDDAFWVLVLHCVLEKGLVAERHAARLKAQVGAARDDGPLGSFVATVLPADHDPSTVREMVRAGAWADLLSLKAGVVWRLWRRDLLGATRRLVPRAIRRGPGFGWLRRGRWGVSVALLGPDGAGKSTLAAAVAAGFGLPVRRVYMGMWSQSQRGSLGRIPGLSILARPIAAWRKALVGEYHRAHGRLVIFDRYTYDAYLPARGRLRRLNSLYLWILARAAPAPSLVIILDAPGDVLYARKGESNPARLEEDRLAFRALSHKLAMVRVVDATGSPDVVRAEVIDLIWRQFLDGSRGR